MKTYNVILAEVSENNDSSVTGMCLLDTTIYRTVQPKYMSELLCKKKNDGLIYETGISIGLIVIIIFLCILFYKIGKVYRK